MFSHYSSVPNNLMLMLENSPEINIVTPRFLATWHKELGMPVLIPGKFTGGESTTYLELFLETELKKLNAKLIH